MSETWLPSLLAETPEDGWNLAVKLSRVGVKTIQPSTEIREKVRAEYSEDANNLILSSQVIAVNFQTVAAANGYWRQI